MIPTARIAGSTLDALMFYFCVLGILLLVGTFLRLKIALLKKWFIPAALIAGAIGLALGPYGLKVFHAEMVNTWAVIPGRLITIVFAPMLMGVTIPNPRKVVNLFGPQAMFSLGGDFLQIGVPFVLTALVFTPYLQTNPLFGSIVELGFSGGHGTAGGMMEVFKDMGWPDGGTLSLMAATVGLFLGIVSGMIIINYGIRKGYTSVIKSSNELKTEDSDILSDKKQTPGSVVTISKDVIESFAFHTALIAIAILIGWFMQKSLANFVKGMPLFPLAMIGGLIVQLVIGKTSWASLIDRKTFQRIQGWALEFLIVAAIASIKVPIIIAYAGPLAITMVLMAALMIIYFFWAGKRMFKEDWFENAIVAYGSLTAVAAVGLMLLRTVDPEMKTNAGVAYALRGPFISPIIGGGLLSASLPLIITQYGALQAGLFFLGLFVLVIILSKVFGWWHKPETN
ncbi:sodium/glutamate symporter [Aminivibrio sp.]|uniref:sodium/glutamate symporter n=1 Tax=Aminivibrio sp. TaxID=1872489 RepID=UPI00345EC588